VLFKQLTQHHGSTPKIVLFVQTRRFDGASVSAGKERIVAEGCDHQRDMRYTVLVDGEFGGPVALFVSVYIIWCMFYWQ
jgi:hypothetical protein